MSGENGGLKFFDLNLLQQHDQEENDALLQQVSKLGYQCVAFNREVTLEKKGQLPPVIKVANKSCPRVTVLHRLTVATADTTVLHSLTNPVANGYDLLSVRPLSDKVLLQCCGSLSVDIVSLDLTGRLEFYLKRQQVKQAIDRGVAFEITYSPLIQDETKRRHVIANSLELVQMTKGKLTILSSGTSRPMELRGPYDVANLGLLLGLKGGECKSAVTRGPRAVLSHADMRLHTAKGVVSCRKVMEEELEEEEMEEEEVMVQEVK